MTSSGYLRYPHIHGDLLVFASEDDIWLAPADGGRAWRLSADSAQVSYPRFSRDGARIAWTSWRDGNPEVYTADSDGSSAGRLTYWADATRVAGWTRDGDVLAVSATGQHEMYLTWAYAVPLEGAPPRRLPFGPVADLAVEETGTALLTGRMNNEPAFWKRYRGGTRGKLWTATAADPLFTRVLADLDGQLASPMVIGERLFFLSDHEGTGNIYSCALDGSDLARHTDHDGMYARNPATDGQRIVYHVAGDIWILDSPDAAEPRKLDVVLGSPAAARAPRLVSARDHLGALDCDQTGQASVVEVRGTVHWLTHKDGPARALHVDPAARARLPRVLGDTGQAVWVTDAAGADALEIGSVTGEGDTVRLAQGVLGNVIDLTASPDGATVAAAAHDGRLLLVDVASGLSGSGPSATHTTFPVSPSTRGSRARAFGSTYSARAGPSLCVSQCTVPRTSTALACPVRSQSRLPRWSAAVTRRGARPAAGAPRVMGSFRGPGASGPSSIQISPAMWYTIRCPSVLGFLAYMPSWSVWRVRPVPSSAQE